MDNKTDNNTGASVEWWEEEFDRWITEMGLNKPMSPPTTNEITISLTDEFYDKLKKFFKTIIAKERKKHGDAGVEWWGLYFCGNLWDTAKRQVDLEFPVSMGYPKECYRISKVKITEIKE